MYSLKYREGRGIRREILLAMTCESTEFHAIFDHLHQAHDFKASYKMSVATMASPLFMQFLGPESLPCDDDSRALHDTSTELSKQAVVDEVVGIVRRIHRFYLDYKFTTQPPSEQNGRSDLPALFSVLSSSIAGRVKRASAEIKPLVSSEIHLSVLG